jgi:hypothetical protein
MNLRPSLASALLLVVLTECTQAPPQYQLRKLPSGREVRILSVIPIRFQSGETTLMLKYQTLLKLEDTAGVQTEVQDVWSVFKADAESAHVTSAIISALEVPSGFIIKSGKGFNFVFERTPDGSWHMR